jgi:hypothetical protein
VCREYEEARLELRRAYGALGVACASDSVNGTIRQEQLGGIIIQQVEGVVSARAAGDPDDTVPATELYAIAATCLRICGVPDDRAEAAARTCVL